MNASSQPTEVVGVSLENIKKYEEYFEYVISEIEAVYFHDPANLVVSDKKGNHKIEFIDETIKKLGTLMKFLEDMKKASKDNDIRETIQKLLKGVRDAKNKCSSINLCLKHEKHFEAFPNHLDELAGNLRQVISDFPQIENLLSKKE